MNQCQETGSLMLPQLRILSGGQSGCDQAALRAAKAAGIPTGGWAPLGWQTEDGPAPWLAEFGLRECPEPGYPARTKRNVADADACLWFGNPHSPGGRLTLRECTRGRVIDTYTVLFGVTTPRMVADWILGTVLEGETTTQNLLVAGNRESSAPGIGAKTEAFLLEVFNLLR